MVPESVHASVVAFEFIDDVHVLRPLSVAIQPKYTGILAVAAGGNFPLQQAVVNAVLHVEGCSPACW